MQTIVRTLTSVGFALLAPASSAVRAQQSPPVPQASRPLGRGDHLRLYESPSDSTPITGRLRSIGNDSITVVPDESAAVAVFFSRADVARIEVERDAHMRDNVATTLAGVGMLGGLSAAVYRCLNNPDQCAAEHDAAAQAAENGDPYVDVSLLMIAGGGLAGALIGYIIAPPPHWEIVAFPTKTAALDGTGHWGLSIGVRYALRAR